MKTIAIIPARGGSKGLYKKNIRDVAGKPLIYWQIKNALDAELVDDVVLASDSRIV
jgi:N-acylneuraminate cytidylyltransferase